MKYSSALNKLDQAAKEHDLRYRNPNITTEEADEQFLEVARPPTNPVPFVTGFVGDLARAAIRAKRALGLDDYFRGDIDGNEKIERKRILLRIRKKMVKISRVHNGEHLTFTGHNEVKRDKGKQTCVNGWQNKSIKSDI